MLFGKQMMPYRFILVIDFLKKNDMVVDVLNKFIKKIVRLRLHDSVKARTPMLGVIKWEMSKRKI